ncbi:MAG: L-lactate dehydrogenase [Clostridia bacterium]|nr:L-lactate dehydrogenase [Clostridia bacterium]
MNKITIIGTGAVGSTIAYTLATQGIATDILLIDIAKEKAEGEALDILQAATYTHPFSIKSGEYADAVGSDIVILTSGVARKPGQSRLDLAQINVNITKSIIPEITKYAPDATYIIVSNPVDVLTYTFIKNSGIPENKIIGSGTSLDTSRLCTTLGGMYNVNPADVNAYTIGEHGDSSFTPWSVANIAGMPIEEFNKDVNLNKDEVEEFVRKSGGIIIKNKGATFYAVCISVCHICKALAQSTDTILPVGTMFHGEYGINDVVMSLPTRIGNMTANGKVMLNLTDDEVEKLKKSAAALKEVIDNVNI